MVDLEKLLEQHRIAWENKRDVLRKRIEKYQKQLDRSDDSKLKVFERKTRNIAQKINSFNPHALDFWLTHDSWTVSEGLILLCDFDPRYTKIELLDKIWWDRKSGKRVPSRSAVRLDVLDLSKSSIQEVIGKETFSHIVFDLKSRHKFLTSIWATGVHHGERFTPSYFVSWAQKKGFNITWVEWALKQKELGNAPRSPLVRLILRAVVNVNPESLSTEIPSFFKSEAVPSSVAGVSRVWWKKILDENIEKIDRDSGGRADIAQVMRWLKKNGGSRILADGERDQLIWVDDSGTRKAVSQKTVSNALSALRIPD